ncbi:MAG: DUF503 domain-containing protein [Candidatus Promineifilaceae bacterium]|jgi:uncharacterized protein YlxP (DUF503 family)
MTTHIATCTIELNLTGVHSLKEKRRIIKSILSRLPREFNVAVAETDKLDVWQSAVISLVTVGNDAAYLHGLLEKSVAWIAKTRPDAPIDAYMIEFR